MTDHKKCVYFQNRTLIIISSDNNFTNIDYQQKSTIEPQIVSKFFAILVQILCKRERNALLMHFKCTLNALQYQSIFYCNKRLQF